MKKIMIFSIILLLYLPLLNLNNTAAQYKHINQIWYDNTNWKFNDKIYIPLYSSKVIIDTIINLPIIKDNYIVNSFDGDFGAEQGNPNIAIDSSGNYAVAWVDSRNGYKEIYAQFYNFYDQPIGNNIVVSETANDWNSSPAIRKEIS